MDATNELYAFDYLLVMSPYGNLYRLYNVEDLPEGYAVCEGREFYTWKGYLKQKYWKYPRVDQKVVNSAVG